MLPEVVAPPPEEPALKSVAAPSHAPRTGAAPSHAVAAAPDTAPSDSSYDAVADTATDADSAPAPSPSSSVQGPRLSLAQLGVGADNPFLDRQADPAAARAAKAERVKRRLDRALAQGLLDHDSANGRGAGSPVMRTLEANIYASTVPLNGSAHFIFVIDSEGKVVSSTLGEASGDREAWVRVARQTAQALSTRKLQVPKGKSVRLTVAVTSRLQLPSGADPGVAVDVLGLPIKKGGGPRSTRVDLLNPKNPLAPLSLAGDPADIGQVPRRVVHSHVVSEELL